MVNTHKSVQVNELLWCLWGVRYDRMKFATIYRSYQFKNARPFNGVVSKYYWVLFFWSGERASPVSINRNDSSSLQDINWKQNSRKDKAELTAHKWRHPTILMHQQQQLLHFGPTKSKKAVPTKTKVDEKQSYPIEFLLYMAIALE